WTHSSRMRPGRDPGRARPSGRLDEQSPPAAWRYADPRKPGGRAGQTTQRPHASGHTLRPTNEDDACLTPAGERPEEAGPDLERVDQLVGDRHRRGHARTRARGIGGTARTPERSPAHLPDRARAVKGAPGAAGLRRPVRWLHLRTLVASPVLRIRLLG